MKKQELINFWLKLWISQNNILRILEKITGLSKNQLFLSDYINDKFIDKIEEYFARLVSWEPIEYILKKAEFYGFDFYVDSRVLIPRNDTEVMVEEAIKTLNKENKKEFLLIDVWTGSSCIAISILKNTKNIKKSYVIDISKKALEVSKINIEKHNLENKIIQINWNLLENNPLAPLSRGIECLLTHDKSNWGIFNIIITANLPYIKNWDFENMDEETIEYEPDLALYWGEKTGFELYEKLIFQVLELKKSTLLGGDLEGAIILFIEIWFDQKELAINFLKKQNLQFEIFKDNWWIDRCIKIYF